MGKLRFQHPKSRNNWNFCPSKLPNQLGKYDDGDRSRANRLGKYDNPGGWSPQCMKKEHPVVQGAPFSNPLNLFNQWSKKNS